MPTLDWLGKKAVVNHHRGVPYRLLHCDKAKSVGDPDAGNLPVQGDNLEALKALLPCYAGKVKCIYIDPHYNTGNEEWTYNDKLNSPEIQAWLGSIVGREAGPFAARQVALHYVSAPSTSQRILDGRRIGLRFDGRQRIGLSPSNTMANTLPLQTTRTKSGL